MRSLGVLYFITLFWNWRMRAKDIFTLFTFSYLTKLFLHLLTFQGQLILGI